MEPILQAKRLRKIFLHPSPVEILKEIDIEIYPGESTAIVGNSGEGKSTLLYLLGTLEEASSGNLYIKGKKVTPSTSAPLRNAHIGFIFQSFHLLEDQTALQNVLMPALIAGKEIRKGSFAHTRALELLEQVGLSHRVSFTTRLLSGGEKQRVAIARALCNDPAILLADEPSGNLDSQTALLIHDLLLSCVQKLGKTLIVVTHNQELAALCTNIHRLHQGILLPERLGPL